MALVQVNSVTKRKAFRTPLRQATAETILAGIAGQAILVISGILVARALGPERRGYLALIVIFPAILSQLGALGLPQAATYFIARRSNNAAAVYNWLKKAFLGQSLVLVIIHVLILSLYVRHEPKEVIVAGFLTFAVIPGLLAQQYGLGILQGCQRYRIFNLMRLMPAATYATVILVLFFVHLTSLASIAFVWGLCNIAVGFSTGYLAKSKVPPWNPENNPTRPPAFSQMLKFGLKGLLGTASPLQNFRLDQLIAGLFISPVALGIYVVGQAFTNLVRFIAQSAGIVAYPAVASDSNPGTARPLIWRFLVGISILNGLVVLSLVMLMPTLVPLFFGKAFSGSIPIARLLLIGAYFESLRQILVEGMRGLGRPEISTWAELAMYPVFAVFGPLLIGLYGLIGLAGAVVACYLISFIVAVVFFCGLVR